MAANPYAPISLKPDTNDSETVLVKKIGVMLQNGATGVTGQSPISVDDDLKSALYKVASLLHACAQGPGSITIA